MRKLRLKWVKSVPLIIFFLWYFVLSNSSFPNFKDCSPLSNKVIAKFSSKNSSVIIFLIIYGGWGGGLSFSYLLIVFFSSNFNSFVSQGAFCFYRSKIFCIGNFICFNLITKSQIPSLFLGLCSHWYCEFCFLLLYFLGIQYTLK